MVKGHASTAQRAVYGAWRRQGRQDRTRASAARREARRAAGTGRAPAGHRTPLRRRLLARDVAGYGLKRKASAAAA